MTWNPYPPLPVEALRDLLGITRALYRATTAADSSDSRLPALEDIGKTLRTVLATRAHPGTNPHQEAWMAAERATKALRELVAESMAAHAPLVEATAKLISRPGSMG